MLCLPYVCNVYGIMGVQCAWMVCEACCWVFMEPLDDTADTRATCQGGSQSGA